MGRSKLFAYETANVTPDIMGLAKGIGGGFPVGAVLATERLIGMVPELMVPHMAAILWLWRQQMPC